ncbi:hypothetical protein H4S02_010623 [Coemansia sp. RSA 2611]|nr:hypothetical protein IWW52_006000 [Coemansia sp. RSA 2704]KAJ2365709.1 hypothetical protein H4S02_010623 [Coemansia sp. RSA 2611]
MSAHRADRFKIDIEALLADRVNCADLVTGDSVDRVSAQMFTRAAAAVADNANARAVFIECNPREVFTESVRSLHPLDPAGLDRIAVKYVASANTLRALLASWHCDASEERALTEADFLLWTEPHSAAEEETRTPDYLFIDGIDAIASTAR